MKFKFDKCDRSVLMQLLQDSKICATNVCEDTNCPLLQFCSKLYDMLYNKEEEEE